MSALASPDLGQGPPALIQWEPALLYLGVLVPCRKGGRLRAPSSPDQTVHSGMTLEDGSVPGAGALPLAKVMRKEARHTLRRDRASGVPLEILEHLPPKPESAYFLLCALTYTSDFKGGCPPLPLSEKRINLQLQLIIPGCDSVSTYKLLWKSSSLPE